MKPLDVNQKILDTFNKSKRALLDCLELKLSIIEQVELKEIVQELVPYTIQLINERREKARLTGIFELPNNLNGFNWAY
ncbi:MAG: hypothetical protein AABX11_07310 [Nanoarchaeota archaeon]